MAAVSLMVFRDEDINATYPATEDHHSRPDFVRAEKKDFTQTRHSNCRREHCRDSLRSRYSHGRPGSRRFQRFLNDLQLRYLAGMEGGFDTAEVKDLYAVHWRSTLSELFHKENQIAFDTFRSCKEKNEGLKDMKKLQGRNPLTPPQMFLRVDRNIRRLLRRGAPAAVIVAIEKELASFLEVSDWKKRRCEPGVLFQAT